MNLKNVGPSGPGTQGQRVRQAPVHCNSSVSLLDHLGLKGSSRRQRILVKFLSLHFTHYAELCLCWSHIVLWACRLWLPYLQELMVRTVSCFKGINFQLSLL